MGEAIPVIIPRENLNDETVTLVAWLVTNGAQVEAGQGLAEVESSKAVFEIPAPLAGIVHYTRQAGEDVEVGGVLCSILSEHRVDGVEPAEAPMGSDEVTGVSAAGIQVSPSIEPAGSALSASCDGPSGVPDQQQTRFSRQALALLKQHGLAPQTFARGGLVRAREIHTALGEGNSQPLASREPSMPGSHRLHPQPIPASGVPVRVERLPRRKRTEVSSLASGYHNTLASVITVAVPTRGLRDAAEQYTPHRVNTTAILLFEVARLLRKYPFFNGFYADESLNIYEEINIGFAIDAGHGLKVPVIRHADTKGLQEIVDDMQEKMVDYLNDTLPVHALLGGTFTITDLSAEGVFTFHPLISQGQAAILGVGGEFFPPGSREGVFTLILAFDHQVSEGRQAAKFLNELGVRLHAYEQVLGDRPGSRKTTEIPRCSRCVMPLTKLQERNHCLVQTVQLDGTPDYICSVCLQGW